MKETFSWQTFVLIIVFCVLCSCGMSTEHAPVHFPSTTAIHAPSQNVLETTDLSAVACATRDNCWAVGSSLDPEEYYQPFIEHWNGVRWSIAQSPKTSETNNYYLTAITCATASFCWAVGQSNVTAESPASVYMAAWAGTVWTSLPGADLAGHSDDLTGVACVSQIECWAVGATTCGIVNDHDGDALDQLPINQNCNGDQTYALIEKWSGGEWNVVTTSFATTFGFLSGISCTAAAYCLAVGGLGTPVLSFDGKTWAISSTPLAGATPPVLDAVSCTSTIECMAVGYSPGTGVNVPYTSLWSDSSWMMHALTLSTVEKENGGGVSAVTCKMIQTCLIVGNFGIRLFGLSYVARLQGRHWLLTFFPSNLGKDHVADIACATDTSCWVVGNVQGQHTDQPLIFAVNP